MPNRKTKAAEPTGEPLGAMTPEAVADEASGKTLVALHSAEIESLYGDGEEYSLERSIAKAQAHMAASAEHFLLAGRELVRIKEHEGHGRFLTVLETRLGIEARAAQRMMQAAVKFLTSGGKVRPLLDGLSVGRSKVIELLILDDEDVEALERGERVAGLERDDIANMSVSELRAALRAAREESAADQDLIRQKSDKIDRLQREVAKMRRGGVEFDTHAYQEALDEGLALFSSGTEAIRRGSAVARDAVEKMMDVEAPAHLDDTAKRAAIMSAYAQVTAAIEVLGRLANEFEEGRASRYVSSGSALA